MWSWLGLYFVLVFERDIVFGELFWAEWSRVSLIRIFDAFEDAVFAHLEVKFDKAFTFTLAELQSLKIPSQCKGCCRHRGQWRWWRWVWGPGLGGGV